MVRWPRIQIRVTDCHTATRFAHQGGYVCRGLRKTALESNVLEPDLHAQLRALEEGALAIDTDPSDGLLNGDAVCASGWLCMPRFA